MTSLTGTNEAISLLYVEDEPEARALLTSIISRKFTSVHLSVAENGREGLESYTRSPTDILITDITMPVMNGIQMARQIKALNPDVMIIVLTAYNEPYYLLECVELGVNQYVIKPIENSILFTALEKCIDAISLKRQVNRQQQFIRKLSRAVDKSPSMVMITDAHGVIEYVNPKFCAVTGYQLEEVVGNNPRMFKSGTTPDAVYRELWETILSGGEWHGDIANRNKNGDLYWEHMSISSIPADDGTVSHFVAVKEDITERKNTEEEIARLNARLMERAAELDEANQELEAFNYSVSHDLRIPLTNINLSCQVIMELCEPLLDETCRKCVREISEGIRQMDQLITTLLNFAKISHTNLDCRLVDLSDMALTIASNLTIAAPPERQVDFRIAQGVQATGDAHLLRIVLGNLMGNAWKFTGTREKAVIAFGLEEANGKQVFCVRDNGIGFDPCRADKLFNPFERLHNSSEFTGTGIGLATVKRIIERHGGRVWAEGKVGEGAAFYFTLPGC